MTYSTTWIRWPRSGRFQRSEAQGPLDVALSIKILKHALHDPTHPPTRHALHTKGVPGVYYDILIARGRCLDGQSARAHARSPSFRSTHTDHHGERARLTSSSSSINSTTLRYCSRNAHSSARLRSSRYWQRTRCCEASSSKASRCSSILARLDCSWSTRTASGVDMWKFERICEINQSYLTRFLRPVNPRPISINLCCSTIHTPDGQHVRTLGVTGRLSDAPGDLRHSLKTDIEMIEFGFLLYLLASFQAAGCLRIQMSGL